MLSLYSCLRKTRKRTKHMGERQNTQRQHDSTNAAPTQNKHTSTHHTRLTTPHTTPTHEKIVIIPGYQWSTNCRPPLHKKSRPPCRPNLGCGHIRGSRKDTCSADKFTAPLCRNVYGALKIHGLCSPEQKNQRAPNIHGPFVRKKPFSVFASHHLSASAF